MKEKIKQVFKWVIVTGAVGAAGYFGGPGAAQLVNDLLKSALGG